MKLLYPVVEVTSSLSKIIKARFVIEDCRQRMVNPVNLSNNSSLAVQANCQPEEFTAETAELIYSETKQMIEELMEDTQRQSDNLLLQAKAQAQDIVEKGQLEGEQLKDQAYKTGFEQGYQEGFANSEQEAIKLAEQTKALLETLVKDKAQIFQKYEHEMVDLVILLTEKILGTTAETKPEVINNIVKRVLAEVGEAEKIVIKVNPIHIPYLKSFDDQQLDSQSKKFQIIEDSTLQPGECMVISENGFIEARITEQLEVLKQTLLEVTGYAGV